MLYSKLDLFVIVLISVSVLVRVSATDDSFRQCEQTVKEWMLASLKSEAKGDEHVLQDFLFFLHVPRTGGRTYLHCFLKKLYSNSQECPRSYDKLRFNPRKTNCHLLSTHDDYSMTSKLPEDRTSVVTILRNPIERVFSTYEFSVEVAARFLIHPNLTSVARMAKYRSKTAGVSTLDIWPWKYLVPWMREDLFARRNSRKIRGLISLQSDDPYDMGDMLMPLHEYINDPMAMDIIHNGATFQIAGVTNNSHFAESHAVRQCVLKYPALGEHVLRVAKKRLDNMLYVGLTENHRESASMFANVVGEQIISQHLMSNSSADVATNDDSEQSSLPSLGKDAGHNHEGNNSDQKPKNVSSIENVEATRKNLTVEKLMETYESCISNLRNTQAERRVNSLKRISPANLTKEARRKVSDVLIEEITSLNSLDVELYKYAQGIFAKQQSNMLQRMVYSEMMENLNMTTGSYIGSYGFPCWRFLSLMAIACFFVLVFVLSLINTKRTSKIKL